ncbi:MAG: glycosyltransferase family 4 protein [Opitutales bacterium]|nr:glycosyltransferase family 4 protein [Opitutales bacterium]
MHVIQLMRKPQTGYHSFERLFSDIRKAMPAGVSVRLVHSPFHSRGLFRRLLNCIHAATLRADVIHITGDIHYLAPALVGRRVVLTVHDLAPLLAKSGLSRRVFRFLWYTLPLRTVKITTAISRAVVDELVRHAGADVGKIRLIPNCFAQEFTPAPKAWPKAPEKTVALMVGTRPNKNLRRMVKALKGLPVEVRIVGQLSAEESAWMDSTGVSVSVLGRLPDEALPEAYRSADLLAFASTYEGFGLPVLEAQATGRPVLTSAIPALREAAGEGALFVDPQSVDSIRQGFQRLLENPALRRSLIEKGSANVARYQPEKIAAMYAEAYREAGGEMRAES